MTISDPKESRTFLPKDFKVKSWDQLEPYFVNLLDRQLNSEEELRDWFHNRSELESVISEDAAWRYINMTRDTTSEEHQKAYQFFISEIEPKIAPYEDKLNRKALEQKEIQNLSDSAFKILVRGLKKEIEIFREENIPINTELQSESQKFGSISGAMTVEHEGEEITLQKAGTYLQETDRELREEIYLKISERRIRDSKTLDGLFNRLVELRHKMAKNAGFSNFRDFMFAKLGRFDYTPEDCFEFQQSIKSEIVPILKKITLEKKERLGYDKLKPWDSAVDPSGKAPLKPFKTGEELLDKSIECFSRIAPYFGDCLNTMKEMGQLDLVSRKGKAPGGYNYPLMETGVPFIFMNATSTLRDLVTLMHEGGHAVHSFLTRDLDLVYFKNTTSEVAELASMSMELISMDHWDVFFDNEEDLKRAKKDHLEQVIETLPWVAIIDSFQHWIYENSSHSISERNEKWVELLSEFSSGVTDWSGQEKFKEYMWQKQLHLFEVPFYYIEYAMAQLGAVAVWKNYKENPEKGLEGYMNALKLGYTRTIPELYEAAHIKFDFSKKYIGELSEFLLKEIETI